MAKSKAEDTKAEKIKVNIGRPATESPVNASGKPPAKKARDDLWSHPDLDGGFAGEMEHRPGETVQPVDLSGPEEKTRDEPEKPPGEPAEDPPEEQTAHVTDKKHEAKPAPEPEAVQPVKEEAPMQEEVPGVSEKESGHADAIYKNDEEFYSSKLNLSNGQDESTKTAKPHAHPGEYRNPRFVFILSLFVTTFIAGIIMLIILEQQQAGSSMLFDYLPLPELGF